jgi:hypothetical protein
MLPGRTEREQRHAREGRGCERNFSWTHLVFSSANCLLHQGRRALVARKRSSRSSVPVPPRIEPVRFRSNRAVRQDGARTR